VVYDIVFIFRHTNMDRPAFYIGTATSKAELASIAKAARKEWQARQKSDSRAKGVQNIHCKKQQKDLRIKNTGIA